ncbi:MAG: peptide deformylase [Bacteroidota bacterium]
MKKLYFLNLFLFILIGVFSCSTKKDTPEPENPIDTISFTKSETDTIMALPDTCKMRILTVFNYNDSLILRKTSHYVRPDSNNVVLQRLIKRMYKTVTDPTNLGVGIAAPQLGILRNIIWVQRLDKTGKPFEVYLNPRIVLYSNKIINFPGDGCLSIPGVTGTSKRYTSVVVEYDCLDGSHHTEIVEGYAGSNYTAVIFQHEIDHLWGVLFIDRLA